MASHQIPNLPDGVHHALVFGAAQVHRSLAQQTIIELRRSTDPSSGQRRRAVLQKIGASLSAEAAESTAVQTEQTTYWIREYRERAER